MNELQSLLLGRAGVISYLNIMSLPPFFPPAFSFHPSLLKYQGHFPGSSLPPVSPCPQPLCFLQVFLYLCLHAIHTETQCNLASTREFCFYSAYMRSRWRVLRRQTCLDLCCRMIPLATAWGLGLTKPKEEAGWGVRKLPHCQLRGCWCALGGKGGVDEKGTDWGHVWTAGCSEGLELQGGKESSITEDG